MRGRWWWPRDDDDGDDDMRTSAEKRMERNGGKEPVSRRSSISRRYPLARAKPYALYKTPPISPTTSSHLTSTRPVATSRSEGDRFGRAIAPNTRILHRNCAETCKSDRGRQKIVNSSRFDDQRYGARLSYGRAIFLSIGRRMAISRQIYVPRVLFLSFADRIPRRSLKTIIFVIEILFTLSRALNR